ARDEGYGMGVIMSGAANTSIVSTDVGLIGGIVINKDNSLIIPVGGVVALTSSILKLIEDESLRNELSQKAKESVQNLGSKESYLQKYKQSWEMALL
ncbi:MAG: glycosyltransferase, partial [Patescibacteria group bacterium]